ncbi:MAG: PadR family transcriptional regulator [Gemmatimonadota bacterium]
MGRKGFIGEFEQVVLLAALQLKNEAHAPAISRKLEDDAGRPVSRGALYSTLDRLERKGFLEWRIEASSGDGDGQPKRRFSVTEQGIAALKASREMLLTLWEGLDEILEGPSA